MAKRRRSAKQRANDKRLGQMAKRRARSSHTTKRRRTRKTIKHVTRRVSVARRRRSAPRRRVSHKRSFASKIPLINNPTFRKAATGIGVATLGATVLGFVAPSLASNPIVKPALAFLGGDIVGLAAQVLSTGGLGSLTGGNGGGSNGGFA